LLNNSPEKLPTQKAMKASLSTFFSWAVRKKYVTVNPTREAKLKDPKKRNVYISFMAIREWIRKYEFALHKDTPGQMSIVGKVNTGPMMRGFIDLRYLAFQRSTEIGLLTWEQIDRAAGVMYFVPTKTAESSDEAVDWQIQAGHRRGLEPGSTSLTRIRPEVCDARPALQTEDPPGLSRRMGGFNAARRPNDRPYVARAYRVCHRLPANSVWQVPRQEVFHPSAPRLPGHILVTHVVPPPPANPPSRGGGGGCRRGGGGGGAGPQEGGGVVGGRVAFAGG